ncbi:MAG TPA: sigma-70 family RNA polymerase sigma factor [Thermoanaerobaculia bacterium]|nr:sigma-70 family RNA polymerase sigma factor [Thermoanaerobaculia bacterium]
MSRTAPTPEGEAALLRRIAAKDRKAFEALYHAYYRRLFAYLLKTTRRIDIAEEVLDDVMLAVWTGASGFDGRSRPSTWIFGIAWHKALKAMARQERHRPESEEVDGEEPADDPGPERLLARREVADALERALRSLSPDQRAVVELTYYHGFSYQEIAEIMSCPVNTVKTRMFHARRRLKELLPTLGVFGREMR